MPSTDGSLFVIAIVWCRRTVESNERMDEDLRRFVRFLCGHGFRCVILRSCGRVLPAFHPCPGWVDVGSLSGDVIDVCRIGRWKEMFAPLPLRFLFPHPSHWVGYSLGSLVHPYGSCEDLLGFLPAPVLFPRWFQAQGDGGGASPFLSSFLDWGGIGFTFGSVFHGKEGQDGSCPSTLPLGRVPIHPMVHSVSSGSNHHTRRRNVVLHGVRRTNPSALERNAERKKQVRNQHTSACAGKQTGSTPPNVNRVEKRRNRASIGSLPNHR